MRMANDVAKRMRDMLLKNSVDLKEGFKTAFEQDVTRVLRDYCELTCKPKISFDMGEDGLFEVKIDAACSSFKQFDTTLEIKRN